jgi:thiol-disulfide isomerase/thioredoxin
MTRWFVGLFVAVVSAGGAGAWFVAAQDLPPPTAAADKDTPAKKADPFVVPDGTPEELVKYIESLKQQRPDDRNLGEFVKKVGRATLDAVDKIMAGKPSDRQTEIAINYRAGALVMLERFGDAEAAKKVKTLPAEIEKLGRPKLAREIQGRIIGSHLQFAEQSGGKGLDDIIARIKSYLAEKPVDEIGVGLAVTAATMAEQTMPDAETAATYQEFGKLFAGNKEPSIAEMGEKMVGAARRLGLVGKPMIVEGTTVDGRTLDWSKYAGKVVLVDFWATWCPPCLAEIPNIVKNYEAYHDRGFDVVGISIDDKKSDLEEFLKENHLAWTIVFDHAAVDEQPSATPLRLRKGDAKEKVVPRPQVRSMADYYGVLGVPLAVLVGKDGKVISLHARGPALSKELEKLLGPADTKGGAKSKTESPADEK